MGQAARTRHAPRGLVAAAAAVLAGTLLAACSSSGAAAPSSPSGSSTSSQKPTPTGNATFPGIHGPAVPATGAYVGAWSKPTDFSQAGRVQAIKTLERGLGRMLDIVHTYRTWDEDFFTPSDLQFISSGYLLQLSWAGADTRKIAAGDYDALIHQRAVAAREMGKPFFMEWRWEMDRPNLSAVVWSPADFIKAWNHIHAIFDQEGVTNAGWVWCPTANGFTDNDAAAYYPGDATVDWICVDAYPGKSWTPMADLLQPFETWAAKHASKPIMIGEFGVPRDRTPGDRATWLEGAAEAFRANPQIKAVSYFDSDPGDHAPARQYSLGDDAAAMQTFAKIVAEPYFNPVDRTMPTP